MDFTTKNYNINLVIISLFLLAIFLPLSFWTPLVSKPFNACLTEIHCRPINVTVESIEDELEEALSKASTGDKTVIITIVNRAYVEPQQEQYPTMLDLFLEGFWVGEGTRWLVDHLVVVSMDQTAYDRCRFLRLNCYRLVTGGADFTEEKLYMSEDFIRMMWTRTLFLLEVLNRGYNFIFTDTDVLWLRDPFPTLKLLNETDDLQISTDKFNGNPSSIKNLINTGFYNVKSNNKTIALFQTWYDRRHNSTGLKEQDVLQNLIAKGSIIESLDLRVRFLDTLYFSGFCRNSKDVRAVVTVHANCCMSIASKVADLTRVLKDWKKFTKPREAPATNSSSNATVPFKWSRHYACRKSWKFSPSSLS